MVFHNAFHHFKELFKERLQNVILNLAFSQFPPMINQMLQSFHILNQDFDGVTVAHFRLKETEDNISLVPVGPFW